MVHAITPVRLCVVYVVRQALPFLSEFWVLDMRALSALMFGLRCPVPRGHVLRYIRARVLVIVPLHACSGPQQTRRFQQFRPFGERIRRSM